jgi:hypothetical protein
MHCVETYGQRSDYVYQQFAYACRFVVKFLLCLCNNRNVSLLVGSRGTVLSSSISFSIFLI